MIMQIIFVTTTEALLLICMMNFKLLQCRHLARHKKWVSEQYLTTRGSTGQNMYASVEGTYWKKKMLKTTVVHIVHELNEQPMYY
jgi:hypothetical protein